MGYRERNEKVRAPTVVEQGSLRESKVPKSGIYLRGKTTDGDPKEVGLIGLIQAITIIF